MSTSEQDKDKCWFRRIRCQNGSSGVYDINAILNDLKEEFCRDDCDRDYNRKQCSNEQDNKFLGMEKYLPTLDRKNYLDLCWAMYQLSYQSIGLHLSKPHDLLKYEEWLLFFHEEKPVAFCLFSTSTFGLKLGLAGTDGSIEAKTLLKNYLRTVCHQLGYYAEVSHGLAHIMKSAPKVKASLARAILGKEIEPSPDGYHYTRKIGSLGKVEKIMVGVPVNVKDIEETESEEREVTTHTATTKTKEAKASPTSDTKKDEAAHDMCLLFDK
jgi:hypothetical protein